MDYNIVGLQSLRALARNIGVKSPTSYTKAQLIKKIKEVESGERAPHFTTRGRPAKKLVGAEKIKENIKIIESKTDIIDQLQFAIRIINQTIEQISKL